MMLTMVLQQVTSTTTPGKVLPPYRAERRGGERGPASRLSITCTLIPQMMTVEMINETRNVKMILITDARVLLFFHDHKKKVLQFTGSKKKSMKWRTPPHELQCNHCFPRTYSLWVSGYCGIFFFSGVSSSP